MIELVVFTAACAKPRIVRSDWLPQASPSHRNDVIVGVPLPLKSYEISRSPLVRWTKPSLFAQASAPWSNSKETNTSLLIVLSI